MTLEPRHFGAFFRAIHGHEPFPWQTALVERLAGGQGWPDVLGIPTGAGKTAALDAAVFHLALDPGAPLRTALVVDRRLIVDDTFAHAERIALALEARSDAHPVLGAVVERLRARAGPHAPPLAVARLLGGVPLEPDWTPTPAQPTILCSTVDQVGSRILFRGYGVSDRMLPVHAGLLGTDTLFLLDEAHLAEPFRQTLEAVRTLGRARIECALLSATPGTASEDRLTLSDRDRAHPVLGPRLRAAKPATLHHPVRHGPGALADACADTARGLLAALDANGPGPHAVAIVVNRVDLARRAFEALDDRSDRILLIGRSRAVERERLAAMLAPFRTGAPRDAPRSLVVVATQCIEVGVDVDVDALVTQAAPLDALRQRFGRLNRGGRAIRAAAAILAAAEDVAAKASDPIYADRTRRTWQVLEALAMERVIDFGADALARTLAALPADSLAAARPDAPVVMPAYLDLWAQTAPRPSADPEVALFLHGSERMGAGVSIVWRADLDPAELGAPDSEGLAERLRLVPPSAAEAVDVPLWSARAWLRGAGPGLDETGDVAERPPDSAPSARYAASVRRALRWAGPSDPRTGTVAPGELSPGDLIVVPAAYGGCDAFGWAPASSAPAEDVAGRAAEPAWHRGCAVRVHPGTIGPAWTRAQPLVADETLSGKALAEALRDTLDTVPIESPEHREVAPIRGALAALAEACGPVDRHHPYDAEPGAGVVLIAEYGLRRLNRGPVSRPATESDELSQRAPRPVTIDAHGADAASRVARYARSLGLPPAVQTDVTLAAWFHDLGKADPRFQRMLGATGAGSPLAKSPAPWSRGATRGTRLPPGWRHEALSVRMARAHPRFADAHDPGLVAWLVGTHHGLGRPFFGFADPTDPSPRPCLGVDAWRLADDGPGPHSPAFELDGLDWPALHDVLKARYGIWGLAHLEALVRLADHRASESPLP